MEVRDGDTHVDLFLNESAQFVEGLVLMVIDGDESAVFANLYGDIEPEVIGRLIGSGNAFDGIDFEDFARQFGSNSEKAPTDVDDQ